MRWQGDNWEIRKGRWQDSAPDSVDHVIADPPYDAATHKGHACGFRKRDAVMFDPIDPTSVAPQLLSRTKRWALCFCADLMISDYGNAVGGHRTTGGNFIRQGIWIKTNPMPQFSGDRPGMWGEPIAIMHADGPMRWNGGGKAASWVAGIPHGDSRNHETPKPVDLMMALVYDFTDPGDLVWDPYCGSGTTGVACLRLGRRFLGHEMQPHYAEIAARRLQAEDRGLTLAEADRGQMSVFDAIDDK